MSFDKEEYYIKPVSYKEAMYYIEKYHYLHRKSPCSYSYGAFEISNGRLGDLAGVITYGKPASPSLCESICGPKESNEVMELTRLWSRDDTPKNLESFLIGNTIPKVQEDILVSFADDEEGHKGYVYQATNWLYTGMSDPSYQWIIKDSNKHSRHMFEEYGGIEEARKELGEDKLERQKVTAKHRYVYFNANRRRKKKLKRKLRYDILDYPKG